MPSDYGSSTKPVKRQSSGLGAPAKPQLPPPPQFQTQTPKFQTVPQTGPTQQAATPAASVAAPAAPPPLVNTATPSPQLQQADASYQARLGQLQQPRGTDPNQQFLIDQYKGRLSTDNTQGLIDRSQLQIADAGSARKAGLTNESGRMGSGAGGRDIGRIDSAVSRAQAASADNIRLGRESQLDALTIGGSNIMNAPGQMELAREQGLNAFTLQGLPYAQSQANLGLSQQGLGLNQWQAQANYGLGAAGLQQQGGIAAQQAAFQQQQFAAQQAQQQQQAQAGYWQMLLQSSGY